MEKFQLSLFHKINGIGSASGIVFNDKFLYVISDNSSFLYQYNTISFNLTKIPLTENCQENIPKQNKFDFEAITLKDNVLHLFGSGFTENRKKNYYSILKT